MFKGLHVAILAGLALFSGSSASALPPTEAEKWQDDIEVYRHTLEQRHINLYHSVGKHDFQGALQVLKEDLPRLTEDQVMVELMRISRLVGDGHTRVPFWSTDHQHYPLLFQFMDGELRLLRTGPEHRRLLGRKLVAVGEMPTAEVVEKLEPVVQTVENEYSLRSHLPYHLNVADILAGLGIVDDPASATFTLEDERGQREMVTLEAISCSDYRESVTVRYAEQIVPFGEKLVTESEYLWLTADEERRVAYVYFARYPSFSDMGSFAEDVREYLDDHRIRNLVIDLRDNTGGDFFVGLRFAHQMILVDGLDWDGGIYTLIGNATFSAGMSNAAHFREMFNATLVGEPTGGNPVGYQDMDSFTLPNSGIEVNYSKRLYRFQDQASQGIQPDVLIPTRWADYRVGRDAVLDWVLEDITARYSGSVDKAAEVTAQ
ncbi:S41 family peptidase [Microbulbifer yueqingensis]|uniref:Peptidase family S41 n=1 Tax=Microbulbifer yueqingensis TaxID=658219 RepID=A0A1G9EKG6_9GAMM|nr:S41 family peptidase [Microbulbifer yueqingensis]SDK76515.1 Peptidase family S41 [Microbulbifer yueqingensis]